MTKQNPLVKRSNFFIPTLRDVPSEAEIISHRYMLRAGMIYQEAAGIYSWLPLGLRVMNKIEQIVREEQDKINSHEILMPTLQPADLWRKSGRYDSYGKEMLRIKDRHERDLLYGPTNEEMITDILASHVRSYKQLPLMLYHIQWKFRDEIRPRFGVMRGREFFMKDGYSFDATMEEGIHAYNRQFIAYLRTYARMGLKAVPMAAETGPIGGNMSHEFIILADTGESAVYCDKAILDLDLSDNAVDLDNPELAQGFVDKITSYYAATDNQLDQGEFDQKVPKERQVTARGIEVGHIFFFGDKYSAPLGAKITDKNGATTPILSGSYGIGVSRLVGGIIEASHDDKGIIWPQAVAPFDAGIVLIRHNDAASVDLATRLAEALVAKGKEVLIDDRDERAGIKFADMELIGLPYCLTIGPKNAENGVIEVKNRRTGDSQDMSLEAVINLI